MKKVAIIIGAIFAVIIAAMILIPIIFKPQIVALIKNQANKNINAAVDFQNVGVSLIRHFPNVTIVVEKLTIINREPFADDTLLSLDKFQGTANLAALLFSKKIDLLSIQLIKPHINLQALKDGRTNWQIFPQLAPTTQTQPAATGSNLNLAIREYKIQDGYLTYVDQSGGVAVEVAKLNHQGKGDFTSQQFTLSTQTEIAGLTAKINEISYLNQASLKVKADIDMDLAQKKFTFRDNEILLNQLALNFGGFVAMTGEDIQIDMNFAAAKANFKDILSMIPYIYQKDFDKLKAEGQLSLQGKIQGIYNKSQIPSFDIGLNVSNGMFQYSQMPVPVNQVAINLQILNPGKSLDEIIVDLKSFHLEIMNESVDARLTARKLLSDPAVEGYVKGRINLGQVKNVFPLGDTIQLAGMVTGDFTFSGKKSSLSAKELQQSTATGTISATDISYSAPSLPVALQIKTANLSLSPQQASLSKFNLIMGKSDISAQGTLQNIVGYVLSGQTLKGTLTTESNNFDLNPFMAQKGGPLQAIPLPDRIEFLMTSHFGSVSLMNMSMTDVKGKLLLKDRTLNLVDLNANLLQGSMVSNGSYKYIPPQKPKMDFTLKLANFDIPDMFKTFVTVQRLAPFAEYMKGSLSGNLNINSDLGDSLLPVWNTLSCRGTLDIPQAKIENFAPLNKVADALKLTAMNNPTMANFNGAIEIKDGRFYLKPTPLKIGQYQVVASGSNGIDKSLDYKLQVQIPASELKATANSVISGLIKQDVNLLTDETVVVDVGVGGTFADPKVNTSSSQIVKSTTDQLKKTAEAEAQKQKQELQQQVQDKLDQQKQELEKAAQEQKDQVKNKIKGLFK